MSGSTQQTLLRLDVQPLPEPEAEIWRILQANHRGRGNAIGMRALAAMVGLSTRSVQSAIEWLIKEHARPIGSSCSRPCGYYVIIDQEDLEHTFRNRVNRGISNLSAAYALKSAPEVQAALGQLSAFIGGGDDS